MQQNNVRTNAESSASVVAVYGNKGRPIGLLKPIMSNTHLRRDATVKLSRVRRRRCVLGFSKLHRYSCRPTNAYFDSLDVNVISVHAV